MARQIRDMVVLIVGASAGIGEALARELSARGAKLILAARRGDRLESLNKSLGGHHLIVAADIGVPGDCQRVVEASADHFGRLDTLVCNAGYGLVRTVDQTQAEEFQKIFQVNLFGTANCIRAAVPIMRGQDERDRWRGQIMIVSSAAARRGLPYFGAYSATKAAQLSLAEAMRVELKPARIAVTSVHPIGTNSDFFKTAEALSNASLSRGRAMEFRQSSETVARKMVRAIRRPRAEVWPFRPARWGINLGVMLPALVDRVMGKARDQMERANPPDRETSDDVSPAAARKD